MAVCVYVFLIRFVLGRVLCFPKTCFIQSCSLKLLKHLVRHRAHRAKR